MRVLLVNLVLVLSIRLLSLYSFWGPFNTYLIYLKINSSQKDVKVFCVALVTGKLTIIYEIDYPSAKYVNLKKRLIYLTFIKSVAINKD